MYLKRNYYIKIILLFFTISVLAGTFIYFEKEEAMVVMGVKVIDKDFYEQLIKDKVQMTVDENLQMQGIKLPYNESEGVYYISQSLESDEWNGKIEVNEENQFYWLKDKMFDDKKRAIQNGHVFSYIVVSGDTYAEGKVVFTGLPVICLDGPDDGENRLSQFSIFWINEDTKHYETFQSISMYHQRGAGSVLFNKGNYKISLLDESGNSVKYGVLGMQKDDDWKLNSLYTDSSNVRDQLSYYLWDKMNELEDEPVLSSSMKYCEVFINNEYMGLYGVMVPINRKSMNLKEGDYLYKVRSWGIPSVDDFEYFSEDDDVWVDHIMTLTCKYPFEIGKGEQWKPLMDYYQLFYWDEEKDVINMEQLVDIDNIIDYYCFCQITYANDNRWKNAYYIMKEQKNGKFKFYKTVWDLNYTWGDNFSDNPQTLWTDFQYHDDLFRDIVDYETLMQMDKDYMVERTQEKWKTWRDTFLNTDSLTSTAKEIMQPLIDSGAWDRNARRWPESENSKDITEMSNWIDYRLNVLDQYIDSLE